MRIRRRQDIGETPATEHPEHGTPTAGYARLTVLAPSERPVGRAPELERLGGLLDDLRAGASGCVAVEGEPGIGKTRLLSELRRLAEQRGHLVLAGAAAEFERDLPFGVWVDALYAYTAAQDLDARGSLEPHILDDLSGVLPTLRPGGAPAVAEQSDERHRAHRALRTLLEHIAENAPAVVILDDLHWSDAASIAVLAALLRRPPTAPVLLALGYRSGRAPGRLAAALGAPSVTILDLGPLSEPECSLVIGDRADESQRAAIYALSGGNPFYTLQLAQSPGPPTRSPVGDRLALDAEVPRAVGAALVAELEALSPVARRLLVSASIAGDPFEPELAFAIGELTPQDGVPALDELLDARLLHVTDVPRRFAFRHPLVRRAVYETGKGGWRLDAHARAARAMAALGATPAARAHHVEQSAARGDRNAIGILCEAGDASAPRAPGGAARWYAAALRLMPEDDRQARVETLAKLAAALRSTGDLERCSDRLLEALELVPPDLDELRLRLTSSAAACEHFLGRHDAAERRLVATLDALPHRTSPEAVTLVLDLAAGAYFLLDLERMCALAEEGLISSRSLGDPGLVATAAALLAHGCAVAGRVPAAQAAADEAAAVIAVLDDARVSRHLDAVNRLRGPSC